MVNIFNNKIKDYNTVTLNKEVGEISSNIILFNEKKFVSFSFFDEKSNNILNTLKPINLINDACFRLSGLILFSDDDGTEVLSRDIISNLYSFADLKSNTIQENMSNVKKVENLIYQNFSCLENEYNKNLTELTYNNENAFYKANIYSLNIHFADRLLLKSIILPGKFNFEAGINYKIEFLTVSHDNNAKFIKEFPIEINANLNNNYVIAFKNLNIYEIKKSNFNKNIFELIEVYGIFETQNGYRYTKKFIYDEFHDFWLISDVPLKAVKLKSLKISVAYL